MASAGEASSTTGSESTVTAAARKLWTRTVGVVGNGFIGSAAQELACDAVRVIAFDLDPKLCVPAGMTMELLCKEADVVWVSVPTPMNADGSACLSIVEKAVASCRKAGATCILLRSTVPPGTSRRLGVAFMPEFLTEANARKDFRESNRWYVGFDAATAVARLSASTSDEPGSMEAAVITKEALEMAHEHGRIGDRGFRCRVLHQTAAAEMIKYAGNVTLASKAGLSNELERVSAALDVPWELVRECMGEDARIGPSHTMVPGPDGHRGFGGTCFPKDVQALRAVGRELGVPTPVLDAVWERNVKIDRPERDWETDKGRAVVGVDPKEAEATETGS